MADSIFTFPFAGSINAFLKKTYIQQFSEQTFYFISTSLLPSMYLCYSLEILHSLAHSTTQSPLINTFHYGGWLWKCMYRGAPLLVSPQKNKFCGLLKIRNNAIWKWRETESFEIISSGSTFPKLKNFRLFKLSLKVLFFLPPQKNKLVNSAPETPPPLKVTWFLRF